MTYDFFKCLYLKHFESWQSEEATSTDSNLVVLIVNAITTRRDRKRKQHRDVEMDINTVSFWGIRIRNDASVELWSRDR